MDLERFSTHIRGLAVQEETDSAVISCYINNEADGADFRDVIDTRIREIRESPAADQRTEFEQALGQIEDFLARDVNPEAKGVALFSRGGDSPFLKVLQFRVSLPNVMIVDSVPHIYELVRLKDTYHRYVIQVSTESNPRIIRRDEMWAGMREKTDILDRLQMEGAQTHLVLAGIPCTAVQVRNMS